MMSNAPSLRRVRVTTAFKARSVDTGDRRLFTEGTLLWRVEIAEETARFVEIGERDVYELPEGEFMARVKKLSR